MTVTVIIDVGRLVLLYIPKTFQNFHCILYWYMFQNHHITFDTFLLENNHSSNTAVGTRNSEWL